MASVKTRKRFMYAVFVSLFILGGVEYAVILPTIWLYLHYDYDAPEYMLGIVLSSYSVAAFLFAPILGRLTDKYQYTKGILIFCAICQTCGSFLYFVGISQWLCAASRFICGIGGSAEAVCLAEIARYTSPQERTSVLSKLIATRELALLGAPGFNLLLQWMEFDVGPFQVNKFSSPGAFMTILSILYGIFLIAFYYEPKNIYADEEELNRLSEAYKQANSDNPEQGENNLYDDVRVKKYSGDLVAAEEDQEDNQRKKLLSTNSPYHAKNNIITTTNPAMPISNGITNGNGDLVQADQVDGRLPTGQIAASNEVLASAERMICSLEEATHQRYNNPNSDSNNIKDPDDLDDLDLEGGSGSWSFVDASDIPPLLQDGADGSGIQSKTNDDYIFNYERCVDGLMTGNGRLAFFCHEYIKDELVAILMILFSALFAQIALEAIITPITLEYLDFGEFENSIMYCLCAVELLIAFAVVSKLSCCVTDRNLIMFGGCLFLCAHISLVLFLPSAKHHDRDSNLLFVVIIVAMDVWSLPFLLVCASSLYSKMVRKEIQGISQGIRRSVTGLGTIMAPLWASSVVQYPRLVLGVMIGVLAFALILCVLSYKRLVGIEEDASTYGSCSKKSSSGSSVGYPNSSATASTNEEETNVLIPPPSSSSRTYGATSTAVNHVNRTVEVRA